MSFAKKGSASAAGMMSATSAGTIVPRKLSPRRSSRKFAAAVSGPPRVRPVMGFGVSTVCSVILSDPVASVTVGRPCP